MRLATKRKRTWVQKLSKKGSKLELLKKSKIELSLQRELNPACPDTPNAASKPAHRKHRNEVRGARESIVRGQAGTKRGPVPPWGEPGSTSSPALGWAFIYRYTLFYGLPLSCQPKLRLLSTQRQGHAHSSTPTTLTSAWQTQNSRHSWQRTCKYF